MLLLPLGHVPCFCLCIHFAAFSVSLQGRPNPALSPEPSSQKLLSRSRYGRKGWADGLMVYGRNSFSKKCISFLVSDLK